MKINKTATGRYQVRWKVWRSGKTIARPQRTFRTRREAQTFVENLAAERRTDRSAATQPFNAYADAWLQTVEARGRKDRTLESYASGLRYARTYFGTTPVGTITPLDAQAFLNYLRNPAECPALKQPRSVLGAWVVFRSTLRLAYRQGALPANPADAVDPPGRVSADRRQARYTFLRPAEVERLASVLDNRHPYGLLVRFAAYTGLRRGEVAGLDVRHITPCPDRERRVVGSGDGLADPAEAWRGVGPRHPEVPQEPDGAAAGVARGGPARLPDRAPRR